MHELNGLIGTGTGPEGQQWQGQVKPGTWQDRHSEQLTSYFCCLNFSCRSNFSASRLWILCHSSLAFSLQEPQWKWSEGQ